MLAALSGAPVLAQNAGGFEDDLESKSLDQILSETALATGQDLGAPDDGAVPPARYDSDDQIPLSEALGEPDTDRPPEIASTGWRGVAIGKPPPRVPPGAWGEMKLDEVMEYQERLEQAQSPEDQDRIRAEMEDVLQERFQAAERERPPPPLSREEILDQLREDGPLRDGRRPGGPGAPDGDGGRTSFDPSGGDGGSSGDGGSGGGSSGGGGGDSGGSTTSGGGGGDSTTRDRPTRERPVRERPVRERPVRERPVRERPPRK